MPKKKPSTFKIRYRNVDSKTGRFVSKNFSRRFPRRVSKKRFYFSTIEGLKGPIKKSQIAPDSRVQALLQLSKGVPQGYHVTRTGKVRFKFKPLTVKGAKKQLAKLKKAAKQDNEELLADSPNYKKWYRAIYKERPDLLPKNVKAFIERRYPEDVEEEIDEEEFGFTE